MRGLALSSIVVVLWIVSSSLGCLFRNPTIFMYPLHASCNITWTLKEKCLGVSQKLIQQMETWKGNATCGNGQKCLYNFVSADGNVLKGTHSSQQSVDDLEFTFYPNTASNGCNVLGYSTSRLPFIVLDFGTNYCNLHNLMQGAGLTRDENYSELTRDEICTQYTSSNCEKY